ncbi:hypothetical protein ABNQ39_00135 (plasmid) [Azospirillum sp. A26]|uniref:hypothetical protein n=1 Tax=Azospirillum sp. A26 TaxID=3160607 RepID=UPI00367309BD
MPSPVASALSQAAHLRLAMGHVDDANLIAVFQDVGDAAIRARLAELSLVPAQRCVVSAEQCAFLSRVLALRGRESRADQ